METTVQQSRKNAIKEATGLSEMAGSCPSDTVFPLLDEYITGTKTMQEVREAFNEQFFATHVVK